MSISDSKASSNTTDSGGSQTGTSEECIQPSEPNRILSMYKDATILITGGTGFLGKILLEKVLRCLEVKKVFLLIRRKDDMSAQERLVKLMQDSVFEKARSFYRTEELLFAKLEAVQMDLDSDSLLCDGSASESEHRLLQETEIIFNVLASVKFNETIRNALVTNVGGTRKVLQLAQRMHRLRSVVHVSTLYSNCNRVEIGEEIYDDLPLRQEVTLQLTTALTEQEMGRFQHCCLGPMPNTYTFSKKCAEIMIRDEFAKLPIGIFRPPIVISTYREPLPGWTDNLNGPSGLCMWTVKGLIHTIWGSASKRANLVPVDYCVNALIAAAYDIMERHRNRCQRQLNSCQNGTGNEVGQLSANSQPDCTNQLPTYNYMYMEHSLTWGRYMEMVSLGFESRMHQMVWNYSYCITAYRPLFRFLSFCFHSIPAALLDLTQVIRRKKPLYRKALRKTTHFLELMSYFGLREWTIGNGNLRRLRSLLSNEEARLLEFDMGTINWAEYFRTYIPGIRRYWFKERTVRGDRWKAVANRRFHFMQRMLRKIIWVWICLRLTRLTSKFVVGNLFTILIA
ncbi:fatty acyl-CoA reductase wat-like [Armigeres subalbatus]|uniref:fatty acyl-CoA reductase wat-like n=1 Tax=Armigeres subalbatus TaxID=124917 RepID=UPI002ED427BF